MKAKLSRLRVRDLALFVVVAGAVAVTTVCGAREIGVDGERAGARTESSEGEQVRPQPDQGQSAKPLTLTLTAPSRCTTTRGQSYGSDEAIYDDEGNYLRTERRFVGHYEVKQFPVSWSASGGTGPYTLTIDGAAEDEAGPFTGASGQGMAYCTNTTIQSFVDEAGDRALRADPMIDSGQKTVRAVVTDANGRTAEASLKVYVVLIWTDPQQILRGGQTYQVEGWIVTIPDGLNMRAGGYEEGDCEVTEEMEAEDPHFCENLNILFFETDGYRVSIAIGEDSGRERARTVLVKDGVRGAQGAGLAQRLGTQLDELGQSVRRP